VKRYDQEFKRDAVSLLINSGKPLKQVANELGVSDASLRAWREAYLEALEGRPAGGEGGPTPRDLVAENQRLRKELERVTWQRDILKKRPAYFQRSRREVCYDQEKNRGQV